MSKPSPAGAIARGLVAGAAGTAMMTAYQMGVAKLRGQPLVPPVPRTWADAPAPAQVAKRLLGRRVTKPQAPLLTNVLHWLYGTGWGAAYGVLQRTLGGPPVAVGAGFGTGVWAAAYAELVPLGIYEPPWKYPPQELALDLSYHLVYGVGVAVTYAALDG
jgi:hypothetical protein